MHAVSRFGCASRLLRGRDPRTRPGAIGRSDRHHARGARAVRLKPRARRSGGPGVDRQRVGDRQHPARPGRRGRARQSDAGPRDQPREGQERPRRRAHAGRAAGRRPAPPGLDRRRLDAGATATHVAPHPARPATDPDQERSVRRPDPQPDRAPQGQRPVRQGRPPVHGDARAARRRASHARWLPAPGRLPRRGARGDRSPSRCSPPTTCAG
jgi:hypothetical protein